jgi:hypothetical protein
VKIVLELVSHGWPAVSKSEYAYHASSQTVVGQCRNAYHDAVATQLTPYMLDVYDYALKRSKRLIPIPTDVSGMEGNGQREALKLMNAVAMIVRI